MQRFRNIIFICLFLCLSFLSYSQQTGFTATIGVNTYNVKKGDILHVCKGGTIIYTSTAKNYGSLEWRYNNGAVSSNFSNTFTVAYASTGNNFYTVQTLNKGSSTADSLKVTIVVSEKEANLKADFDYDPKTLECGNDLFTFDASKSTGTGLKYFWNFGDGTIASGIKATHSFTTATGSSGNVTFPVTLTLTNADGCSEVKEQDVIVKKIPDATLATPDFTVDTVTFNGVPTFKKCDSLAQYTFMFKNASSTVSGNTSYDITWGYGAPATTSLKTFGEADILSHDYPLGSTPLLLAITGQNGCVGKKQYNVFLGSSPGGGLLNPGNTDYCVGNTIAIPIDQVTTARNPPGTIYKLYVIDEFTPDTTFTTVPAAINYTFPFSSCGYIDHDGNQNSFFAKLTMENPCSPTASYINRIHVTGSSKSKFSISPDSAGCINTVFNCNNISDFGNVVNTAGECNRTGLQVWDIKPKDGFTLVNGTDTGKINGIITNLNNWKAGTENLNAKFTKAGTWQITLYTTNAKSSKCNFVDSITRTICVQDKPDAKFSIAANDNNRCGNDTLTFNNLSPAGSCLVNDYEWNITKNDPAGCSSLQPVYLENTTENSASPKVWMKGAGSYTVSLTSSVAKDEACATTNTQIWNIKDKPHTPLNSASAMCAGNSFAPAADTTNCYGMTATAYSWKFPGSEQKTATNYPAGLITYNTPGTYSFNVSAANECGIYNDTSSITIVSKPVANAGNDVSICDGSKIALGVNTGNYTYQWSPASGLSDASIATPTVSLSYTGTKADTVTYTLHVSAGSNCDSSASVRVIVKPKPSLLVDKNSISICKSSSAIVTASGADSYSWTPANNVTPPDGATVTLSPSVSAVYTVTGKLANGCDASKEISVMVNEAATADAGLPDSVCNGSSINIGTSTGSFNYSWLPAKDMSDPAAAVTTLTPSGYTKDTVVKYILTADAGAGCSAEDSVFIKIKQAPVVSIASPSLPIALCSGNNITVVTKGADSYTWQPNASLNTTSGAEVLVTPTTTDTYTVTGTLANGCEADTSFTITVNPNAIAAFTPNGYGNCAPFNLDSIVKSEDHPGENSQYTWHILYHNRDSIQTFSSAQSPNFALQNAGDSAEIYLTAKSKYSCKDSTTSSIKIRAGNGVKAAFTKSGTSGCEPVAVSFTNQSSILDNSVHYTWLFGNGDTSYEIQPSNMVQYSTGGLRHNDTTYYIKLYASNNCSLDSLADSIHVLPKPVGSFGTDDTTSKCSPDTLKFDNHSYGNSISFTWDFDDGKSFSTNRDTSVHHVFTTNTLDTFAIRLTAKNGCGENTTMLPVVIAPNSIRVQVSTFANSLYGCAPDTAFFMNNTTNAVNSVWNYGDGTGENLPGNIVTVSHIYDTPGDYPVIVSFNNGCSIAADTEYVHVSAWPEADFTINQPSNKVICLGDSISLTINQQTGDYNSLYWGDNNLFYSPPVTSHVYENTGRYLVRLQADRINTIGTVCTITDSEYVNVVVKPNVAVAKPNIINCFTDSAKLSASGGAKYTWLPAIALSSNRIADPVARPNETTTYTVSIESAAGCVQQRSAIVVVNRTAGQNKFELPSAFTPNGDGRNDCFRVPRPTKIDSFTLRIFDRLGQQLFITDNVDDCWDGTFRGKRMPVGTYVYTLELKSECSPEGADKISRRKGTIVLIR